MQIILAVEIQPVSVALVIQHAMRMSHILLSSVAFPAVQYFCTLSHNRHDFLRKRVIEHNTVFRVSLEFYLKHFSF